MPVREAPDRRGRPVRGRFGLLERELALGAIVAAVEAAEQGAGRALLLEGHAGMGKTRLYEAALDNARDRGLRVLRAAGTELEQNMAHGVAGQLLRSLLAELEDAERDALLAQAPESLVSLAIVAGQRGEPASSSDLAVSHGFFTVLALAAEERGLLIAVDDLSWSDAPSLELILYLLNRLDELPAAMVLTRRPTSGATASVVLDRIAAHPAIQIERLMPLGSDAVAELVRQALPERAEPALIDTCIEVTAGNPFYLHELLLALAEDPDLPTEELARRARALAPDAVTRVLRVRVGRLGPAAAALARAVAILGDDVPLRHTAALAGLGIDEAGRAADALAAAEVLLAREPLRFVHPLVRRAIDRDVPPLERAARHLDAAKLLHADGAEPERVAAHLLLGRAEADPWAVDVLRAAAREAASRAGWLSSVRYLKRALEEPPPAELRPEVLAELGVAESAIGDPDAAGHLAQAAAASADPGLRAELALQRGRALANLGAHEQAANAYEEGLRELPADPSGLPERELRDQLDTAFVVTGTMVPSLEARALERSAKLLRRAAAGASTQGQRLMLAQAALHAAASGRPVAEVEELADRAWDGGRLLEQAHPQRIGWRTAATALCLSGALERSIEITDAALEEARREGSPLAFATASYVRALPALWRGAVDEAAADLEHARDARRYGWHEFSRSAAAHYALCLIERGDLDDAEAVLAEDGRREEPYDLEDVLRTFSLAELRLAQGRAEEAFELASAAGRAGERTVAFLGYCPWRPVAAAAAVALGERDRALELARDALERAERTQALHLRISALRIMGVCEEDLGRLRAAVELGLASPPRLATTRALVELGAALRRDNQRAAAREPLQRAADLAHRGGARALYERARTELAATGARPRRETFLTGPASLTPSERRIAEIAAAGRTNREIAQTLFVTPKTVEYHLRNAYRKLGIETRRELQDALSP